MKTEYKFAKRETSDKVWWVVYPQSIGELLISFDKKKVYNLYADYPHAFTPEEKRIFDEENPFWKEFFRGRVDE